MAPSGSPPVIETAAVPSKRCEVSSVAGVDAKGQREAVEEGGEQGSGLIPDIEKIAKQSVDPSVGIELEGADAVTDGCHARRLRSPECDAESAGGGIIERGEQDVRCDRRSRDLAGLMRPDSMGPVTG